jgi:serine/threonine protein phosphatase 1
MEKSIRIEGFTLPKGRRVYAIGDIHGHAKVLEKMHAMIDADRADFDPAQAAIVYIGDYVSRGPDSAGVLDLLLAREENGDTHNIFLYGNHENGILEFLSDPPGKKRSWFTWPDVAFLESYGIAERENEPAEELSARLEEAMPQAHIDLMRKMPLYHEEKDFLFVHSGVRPGIGLLEQKREDLFNTREPFLSHEDPHPHYVVHGHTACRDFKVDVRPNRMNIDTGLYSGGPLTCAVFEGNDVRFLQAWQDN